MNQADNPKFPQTIVGSLYPTNYVVAVIDNLEEAQLAEQAFRERGYAIGASRLMSSQEALAKISELEQKKNSLQRFLSSFQAATDETGADIYQFEAKLGHHIFYVRALSQREIDQIRDLLADYHAHTLKFFGLWSVMDIPPRQVVRH